VQQTTAEVPIALAPRPTVLLHGLWSDADTWSNYAGFQSAEHPLWQARAVDTMNTGVLLLPFGTVNTLDQNAEAAWTFIEGVRSSLNAGQVDIVAHSMGGIIIRRVLHMTAHAGAAQAAIRSIAMLGTPNGGSPCADTWAVPATEPLRPSTMSTFNDANPGYPGVFSSLAYSTRDSNTCFSVQPGDSVVPEWSARAQSVSTLIQAAGVSCGNAFTLSCIVGHTDMTADHGWFRNYVLQYLAVPSPPTESGSTAVVTPPTDTDQVLFSGSVPASAQATTVSETHPVTLAAGEKLIVSVTSSASNFAVSYPSGGSTTLVKKPSVPVYDAEIAGPLTSVNVTLSGTTTAGITWAFTKVIP